MTDGNGNVVSDYTYDVFGEVRSGTPPYYDDAFLFTGEQRDWETGLHSAPATTTRPSGGSCRRPR